MNITFYSAVLALTIIAGYAIKEHTEELKSYCTAKGGTLHYDVAIKASYCKLENGKMFTQIPK